MTTIDRMKDKHNEATKQLAKISARRDKLITSLVRVEFQRVALIRAVARSSKRLDKARSLAALNAPLPDAKPEPLDLGSLTPEQAEPKPVRAIPYSEAHPHSKWAKATKRPRGHADLTDFANTFPQAVRESLEDSRKADGKAKRKPRRTPDDFKADVEKRSATDGSR
jgi:hypothetical protein